jgi:hypothetical protein
MILYKKALICLICLYINPLDKNTLLLNTFKIVFFGGQIPCILKLMTNMKNIWTEEVLYTERNKNGRFAPPVFYAASIWILRGFTFSDLAILTVRIPA